MAESTVVRLEAFVCVDCYTAYHYGADSLENPDPRWSAEDFRKGISEGEWADWYCVSHEYGMKVCPFCDTDSDGEVTFSTKKCDCCGTNIAGSRHRMSYYTE